MARYNPNDPNDYLEVIDFINRAKEEGFDIELDKYHMKRSGQQNRYLYFCLSWFAHNYGCTLIEAKEVYLKQIAAPQVFECHLGSVTYYRSTSDLNTVEISNAIANFRAYAEMNGIQIPLPYEIRAIRKCEREISKTKSYGT